MGASPRGCRGSSVKPLAEFAAEHNPKVAAQQVADAAAVLEREGYVVQKPQPADLTLDFDMSHIRGTRVKVAIISDTHLGSKQQQLSYLREFAAYARKLRVDAVLHCGDVVDGPPQMHPGHLHNIFLQTYEAQRSYAIEHLPDFGKIPVYVISGNHDES